MSCSAAKRSVGTTDDPLRLYTYPMTKRRPPPQRVHHDAGVALDIMDLEAAFWTGFKLHDVADAPARQ